MNAIEVKNLVFGYTGTINAVNDVSFNIPQGSYVSIIGPNGSGKSTLAKLITGLLNKKSGEITVFGLPLNKENVNEIRRHIGIVFQNPDNQFISATVEDDIAFGLENRQIPTEDMPSIVRDYAEKVGMIDYLNKEPSSLSGGQKQRVAIAGVLAMHPDIIILDEATSMLDPRGRREIRDLISKLRANNPRLTIISITHDIEEANLSDFIVVLNKGQVMLKGSRDEVFSHEKELNDIHLSVPFIQYIRRKLKEKGIDIGQASNLDELVDFICR